MYAKDREALLCDLAETYHIYDFYSVPVTTLAILAAGLKGDSRIRLKLKGYHDIPDKYLMIRIADALTAIVNSCAEKGKQTGYYADEFTGVKAPSDNLASFETPDAYQAARARFDKE